MRIDIDCVSIMDEGLVSSMQQISLVRSPTNS